MSKTLTDTALKIGLWLENNNYKGIDVASGNMVVQCSTTYSFSAKGWVNLYTKTGNDSYLQKAVDCAERILSLQGPNGSWPFPAKFRNNPAGHYYACETLFTATVLPDMYVQTKDRRYLDSAIRAKKFLLDSNGFQKIVEDEHCLWYSSTDKIHVPNLGSFGGNFFSKLYQISGAPEDYEVARALANFCVRSLERNGRMPYYKPPRDFELLDSQSYQYDLSSHRLSSIEQLSRIYSTSYHALSAFEIDEIYSKTRNDSFKNFVLMSARFLSPLQKRRGDLPEKETKASPFRISRSRKSNIRHTTAKTLAWSAKAFLAAGKYQNRYRRNAVRAIGYLTDKCINEDGGCRYFVYLDGSTKEEEKFVRGAAIAFEGITNFV